VQQRISRSDEEKGKEKTGNSINILPVKCNLILTGKIFILYAVSGFCIKFRKEMLPSRQFIGLNIMSMYADQERQFLEWLVKNQPKIEKYFHLLEKTVSEHQDKDEQLQSIISTITNNVKNILPRGFVDTGRFELFCLWVAIVTLIAKIYKYKINKEAAVLLIGRIPHPTISDIAYSINSYSLYSEDYSLKFEDHIFMMHPRWQRYITLASREDWVVEAHLSELTVKICQNTGKFFESLRATASLPTLYSLDKFLQLDTTKDAVFVKETLINAVRSLPFGIHKSLIVKVAFLEAVGKISLDLTYLRYESAYTTSFVLEALKVYALVTDVLDEPPPLDEESPIPQLRDYKRVEQEVKQAEEKIEQAKEEFERTKEKLKLSQKEVENLIANTSDIATLYHIWQHNIDDNKATRNRLKELYKDKIPDDATPWFYEKPVKQYKYLQIRWSKTVEEDGEKITEEGEIHIGNANKYKLSNAKDGNSVNI